MKTVCIESLISRDRRFPLVGGVGSDAVHTGAEYGYAVAEIAAGTLRGTGIALTLGRGNELVCDAIGMMGAPLVGRDIEETMAAFGAFQRQLADHPQLRWLGPHKGVTHLALASLTNACFDLWAKARGVPLWKLLLSLSPEQIVSLIDFSYIEDVLTPAEALSIIDNHWPTRGEREGVLTDGYPGYDTSVGWFQFDDQRVIDSALEARARGFRAVKLKVGSVDGERDLRRARLLREALGGETLIMLDANQQWSVEKALRMSKALSEISPYWVEEPTHPDDVFGHRRIAEEIAPVKVAAGEHVPNRVLFKAFLQAGAMHFVQADCVRLAGVSEFLAVSLMARKYGLPVAPHVGDMGQIHQHLVLFNHIALGHERLFLEHIPHLREYLVHPATVEGGVYVTPQEPGLSCDLHPAK
jgi:L-fuconate dehydratase